MERMYQQKASIMRRKKGKAHHLFVNMRDRIQTYSVFASKHYDQNQSFLEKL